MKLSKLLRRSLAMLLLLTMLLSLVPNVFAADGEDDLGKISIEIPPELADESVVEATFGKDGEIIYRKASEETISAVNNKPEQSTYADVTDMLGNRAGTGLSASQRLAFFIDPSNTEGNSNYVTYTLNADIIKNLVAAGVTDLFVMVKPRAGDSTPDSETTASFSFTNLNLANSNKGTAKVYAWVHCARDDGYLAKYKTSAQYHYRAGYNNAQNGGDDSVSGWVHLGNANYIKYMEDLMKDIAATSTDGILLDSVRFGTEYTGWDNDARTYMGKDNWNNAVKAMCATAYEQYGSTYRYAAESSGTYKGYYKYVASGGSTNTSGDTLYDIRSTTAGTSFINYRRSVITNFIGKMKTAFGSSKIIAVALERDFANTFTNVSVRGQYPYHFRDHIKNGFCVTMEVVDEHNSDPITLAKTVAKWTNVMIGVDAYKVGSVNNQGYNNIHSITDLSANIHQARFDVNGDYATYRGGILGAACYTAGHIGAIKVDITNYDSSAQTGFMKATIANPNKATYRMLTYFNAAELSHRDSNVGYNFDYSGHGNGSNSGYNGTMKYYCHSNGSGNGVNGYIHNNGTPSGATVAAFGKTTIEAPLRYYDRNYSWPYMFRIGLYAVTNQNTYYDCVGHYSVYYFNSHTTCTSFTDTVLVTANCTTTGYKRRTCKTCGYDFIVEVAKTGHKETSTVTTAATCTTDGLRTYTCSVCSNVRTEVIAALGHDYQAVVTPPTCLDGGYTTYTCSRDASHTYIGDEVPATGHSFAGGVCTACGFALAKLIHFKENSEENTWDWELIGGGGLGFDTTTDGAMYGTTDGTVAPYFYIDPSNTGNINHTMETGDIIEIRMRVTNYNGTATTATPTVSMDTNSTETYGNTLSGTSIDLTSEEWQIVRINITGYAAGDTIERAWINVFGNQALAADVEIDYIHFGTPDATPITITFYNHDGKLLCEPSMIAPGTKAEYHGETPIKRSSAGFTYTFSGWLATSEKLPAEGLFIDKDALSTVAFAVDTALTAQFTYERGDVEPLDSNKYLVDNDGDLEDYIYDIEIDASTYGHSVTINKEYKTPMDIVIVMDRSLSTAFHADESKDFTLGAYTAANLTKLNNYLDTLDKTKPEGYYTASNWLFSSYTGGIDKYAGGFLSYENMRWNASKGYWEVWRTITYDEAVTKVNTIKNNISSYPAYSGKSYDQWTFLMGASVMYNIYNWKYQNTDAGSWVPVTTAYKEFHTRMNAYRDAYGEPDETTYPRSNILFRIGISRRGLMQDALDDFVNQVYATTDELPQGMYHRVSIVGYGYGAYKAGRTASYSYRRRDTSGNLLDADGNIVSTESSAQLRTGSFTTTTAGDPGVTCDPVMLDSAADVTSIHKVIDNPFAFGSTYTDDALKLAKDHITTMNPAARGAQGVVVLFTDGCPTYGSVFIKETANNALVAAKAIKDTGTKLFTVGFMAGLNTATKPAAMTSLASSQETKNANTFLHLASSNYPAANTMPETTAAVNALVGNPNAGYYYSTVDGSDLAKHFADIFTTSHSTTMVDTQITGPLTIRDTVTREWDVMKDGSGNWDITVERCDYLGMGDFSAPKAIDNTGNAVYTLTTTELTDSTGALTGETEIVVDWKDAPNAWLREAEEADPTGYMGYKLLITIGIQLDRDSTIGGNNIPTNTPDSGIFYPTNHDLDHLYKVPDVNVELEYDYKVHDYFLDLYHDDGTTDLLSILKASDTTKYKTEVFSSMYTRTTPIDGLNNRFVSIDHYAATNRYTENIAVGATTATAATSTADFNFAADASGMATGYTITQTTSKPDSLGRPAFPPKEVSKTTNFYAPKYTVVDYQTTASVRMYNEIPAKLNVVLGENAVFDTSSSVAKYTFRYDADKGSEAIHIMTGIEEVPYTVTAINTPKGAMSNQISRKIHIIPANVVEYDFEVLQKYAYVAGSNFTGNWKLEGTKDDTKQKEDNTQIHGYDSNLQSSSSKEPYSYGRTYRTTVSANVRGGDGNVAIYNNNAALTFTFKGTGFDVLSQTGPDEGVMIVEVYTDKNDPSTLVKRIMADNYLANDTLYQVPVIRVMDLTYGTYDVVIRAFYSEAFSHYVPVITSQVNDAALGSAITTGNVITAHPIDGYHVEAYHVAKTTGPVNLIVKGNTCVVRGTSDCTILVEFKKDEEETEEETAEEKAATVNAPNIPVMSEARVREILGLSEDDLLEYTLSADRAIVTRSLTDLTYDVNVDGVRIYNTLNDELTATNNPVAYHAYGLANEINAQFKNLREYMLDTSNWKYSTPNGEALTGALYIASDGDNTNVSATDSAIHLNSTGIFNYETVNGVKYLIDVDGNRIKHPKYGKDIYVVVNGNKCTYYCVNSDNVQFSMTGKEVGEILGQDKVVFYNSYYNVNSPKNEVYLNANNGIAFNVSGATLLKVSAKSIDFDTTTATNTAVILQAYDWKNSEFVDVGTVYKNTEMYYDLSDYIGSNGDVIIRNFNDSTHKGVISLLNIKIAGAEVKVPTAASKAIDLIQNPESEIVCEHTELTYGEAKAATCVDEGNIAFWYCDDCETFFLDEAATERIDAATTVVAPTGIHSYVDGACTVCGAEEVVEDTDLVDEKLTASTAISAGSEIKVVYTVRAEAVADYASFYIVIEKANAEGEAVTTIYGEGHNELETILNPNTGEAAMYRVTYTGINAKEMGDKFTATVYAVTEDGKTYSGNEISYTIKSYLMNKLDDAASSEELKTLVVDMLNYGAAAQLYFDYNTENLVNADLTAEQAACGTQTIASAEASNAIAGEGVNINTNIALQNKVTLYLTSSYKTDAALQYVIKDAKTGDIIAQITPEAIADGYWKCAFEEFKARDMRKALIIELYADDELVSKTVTFSIEGYVAQVRASETASEVLRGLVDAMLIYGDSVAAYLEATEQ